MSDFQLYRDRKFGDYLNDTIKFFRTHGRNYFPKLLVINGAIILGMSLLLFFLYRSYYNIGYFYFSPAVVILFAALFIFGISFLVFMLGFPNVYFDYLENNQEKEISYLDIFKGILSLFGEIIIFFLVSMFVFIPATFALTYLSTFLFRYLIGYLIFGIGIVFLFSWVNLSLIIYIRDIYVGYFEAIGAAWKIICKGFIHIVGANMVLLLIVYLLQTITSLFPMLFIGFLQALGGIHTDAAFITSTMSYLFLLSIIIGSILCNFIFVQQFLVYFSSVEKEEGIQSISELDLIGKNEE